MGKSWEQLEHDRFVRALKEYVIGVLIVSVVKIISPSTGDTLLL